MRGTISRALRAACRAVAAKITLLTTERGIFGVFFEVMGQCRGDGLIDGSGHLAVAQFGLGLAFELRFLYLDRNYSGKSFAEVVTVDLEFYFG